jgi:hypothetical protein
MDLPVDNSNVFCIWRWPTNILRDLGMLPADINEYSWFVGYCMHRVDKNIHQQLLFCLAIGAKYFPGTTMNLVYQSECFHIQCLLYPAMADKYFS